MENITWKKRVHPNYKGFKKIEPHIPKDKVNVFKKIMEKAPNTHFTSEAGSIIFPLYTGEEALYEAQNIKGEIRRFTTLYEAKDWCEKTMTLIFQK